MSHRLTLPALLALVACFTGGWFLQRRLGVGPDVYQQARLFEEVLAHVRDYHVDSLPESELYHRAIDGMLEQLHDPYAALLVGKDYQRQQERTTGDYGGIGLQVDARNGWITVVAPMPGHARRAGRDPAGRSAGRGGRRSPRRDWTMERAVQALRGPDRHDDRPGRATRRRRGAAAPAAHARADSPARGLRGIAARRRRRLSVALDGAGELRRGAGPGGRAPGIAGDAVAGAGPPLGSGRPARRGGAGGRHLPRSAAGHPREPGPRARATTTAGAMERRSAGLRCRSSCWSTAGRRARRRSSRARCRTTTAPSSSATRPTARASCRPCSRWGPTWPSASPLPAGTRPAAGRSRARCSTRRWARRTPRRLGGVPLRRGATARGWRRHRARRAAGARHLQHRGAGVQPRARRSARGLPRCGQRVPRSTFAGAGPSAPRTSWLIGRWGSRCGERLAARGVRLPDSTYAGGEQLGGATARVRGGPLCLRSDGGATAAGD